MTLINQTPVPSVKIQEPEKPEDFFQENIVYIIAGVLLLILLIVLFFYLFLGNKKSKKPVLQFMPYYVQSK